MARATRRNSRIGSAEIAAQAATFVSARDCRTIVLGDSIDSAAQGWYSYYSIGSKKIKTIRNAGAAGNTTAMMLARIQADVLAYLPDVVIFGSIINDMNGVAEATTRANIKAMVGMVRATGAVPVLRTTTPSDNVGTGPWNSIALARQEILRHNAWIKGYAASVGLDVLDVYQAVADPVTGGYQAGMTSDGTHPLEVGYKAIADYLLALPIPAVWKGGFPFARAVTDGGNMLVNGVFTGVAGNGLATGWTFSGTPTFTTTVGGAGITGNYQRVTAADASTVAALQDIATGYSTGDVIEVCGRVRTSGTATGLVRVAPLSSAQLATDPVPSLTKAIDGVFSARLTVPGDLTKLRLMVQTGGAAGWIEVAEVALRNLTTMGLAGL